MSQHEKITPTEGGLDAEQREALRQETLRQVSRTLAHEINNMLAAILGTAQLTQLTFRDRGLPPEEEERLERDMERIVQASQRIAQVIYRLGRIRKIATRPFLEEASELMIDLENSTYYEPML